MINRFGETMSSLSPQQDSRGHEARRAECPLLGDYANEEGQGTQLFSACFGKSRRPTSSCTARRGAPNSKTDTGIV